MSSSEVVLLVWPDLGRHTVEVLDIGTSRAAILGRRPVSANSGPALMKSLNDWTEATLPDADEGDGNYRGPKLPVVIVSARGNRRDNSSLKGGVFWGADHFCFADPRQRSFNGTPPLLT